MNILLVDDDRFVLSALNQNMNWEALGLKEVFMVSNISQAKEIIKEKPVHILITDIDMPQGTGIDLLSWIRENNYDIQTIFLTNYADFSFAQKAVELQSLEYYLKPIQFDKLNLIIKKAVKKAESARQTKKALSISNMWEDIKTNISEHFWMAYIKQENTYTEEELKHQLNKNHLSYKKTDEFVTVLFDLYSITLSHNNIKCCYQDEKKLNTGFYNTFHEVFAGVLSPYDILLELNPVSGNFIAILRCDKSMEDKLLTVLSDYCEKLIALVNKKFSSSLSCYIGLPATFDTFHYRLQQLRSMNENIIDCRNRVFLLSSYVPVTADYMVPNLKLLDEYLRLEKHSLFTEYCEDYLFTLSQSKKLNYTVIASFQIDIIQLIYYFLKEKGILAHKLIQGRTNDILLELSVKSVENMIMYISYLVCTSLDYAKFSASQKSVASIICDYIDIHFTEDISRNSLAEIVYLDPDYTARLFKKETGSSLVNYIIKKRIATAKDLLVNTDLSVNLISDKVGYGNYSYFTKLFKKETGVTPVDYRRINKETINSRITKN
ncbi:response regulator transcription factor [Anaerocolumna sp. MB42-C2]|uniref:response regulator transcription factor n=1 Tax=Anaerocolumna sp. MB42-C2 TaxID=3070997 RepID=UPI0027DEC6F8|nr:response regulator [Anaerocolumna sp. MB42-C2]WMJ89662.1 response regulator [Anaerocolumna sp. MB42-C2]